METKICSKCNIEKSLSDFNTRTDRKIGVKSQCKKCLKRPPKPKKYNSEEERKEGKRLTNKKYRNKIENKEKAKKRNNKWIKNNIEKIKKSKIKWCKDNIEKVKKIKKEGYKRNKIKNKYIIAWRGMLKSVLKRLNKNKEGHTIDLLGYSALDLKNHITSLFTDGMSWDNHGEWHIDHIKPVSKFDKETPMSIVNALSNLQPLWETTREINGVIFEGNLNKREKYLD